MPLPIPLDDGVAISGQQAFARGMEAMAQTGIQATQMGQFVNGQAQLQFLTANANAELAAGILGQRSARDQPGVSPAGAFTVGVPAHPTP